MAEHTEMDGHGSSELDAWHIKEECAIAAYLAGYPAKALELYRMLIRDPQCPNEELGRVEAIVSSIENVLEVECEDCRTGLD